jgi:methionyl aminopeptidase
MLPHDYRLRAGDVLGMDLAVGIDGWVADSSVTVIVGTASENDGRLVPATRVALEAATEAARPGDRLGDVSAAIGAVAAGLVEQLPGGTVLDGAIWGREQDVHRVVYGPGELLRPSLWTAHPWSVYDALLHPIDPSDAAIRQACLAARAARQGTPTPVAPWPVGSRG